MEAYSCTECGRCTSECPANTTRKLLSPRKIMMDSRDRIEEIGKNMDANGGEFKPDEKSLVGSYITEEELWFVRLVKRVLKLALSISVLWVSF